MSSLLSCSLSYGRYRCAGDACISDSRKRRTSVLGCVSYHPTLYMSTRHQPKGRGKEQTDTFVQYDDVLAVNGERPKRLARGNLHYFISTRSTVVRGYKQPPITNRNPCVVLVCISMYSLRVDYRLYSFLHCLFLVVLLLIIKKYKPSAGSMYVPSLFV